MILIKYCNQTGTVHCNAVMESNRSDGGAGAASPGPFSHLQTFSKVVLYRLKLSRSITHKQDAVKTQQMRLPNCIKLDNKLQSRFFLFFFFLSKQATDN